MTVESRTNACE